MDDIIEVARASTLVSTDKDAMIDGKYIINMGFVNEMIPDNTYLIFLDRKINTHDEETNIFIQSDNYLLAPIFCYENILSSPQIPKDEYNTYINYENVKNNELFIMSEVSNERIQVMKEKLFNKYKYDS